MGTINNFPISTVDAQGIVDVLVQETNNKVTEAAAFAGAAARSAGAAATSAGAAATSASAADAARTEVQSLVPKRDVVELLSDLTNYPVGTVVTTRKEMASFEVVSANEHFTTAGGSKIRLIKKGVTLYGEALQNDANLIGSIGQKVDGFKFKRTVSGHGVVINAYKTELHNSSVDMDFATIGGGGHGVVILANDVRLERVSVDGIGNSASGQAGSAIISYTSGTGVQRYRVEVIDYRVSSDIGSVDTNGALLEDVWYGRLRGGNATDIVSFAHELKHNARWNILSDLMTVNSGFAVGYGQSEATIDGADFNICYGWNGHGVDTGLVVGEGTYNLFGLQLTDGTGSPLTTAGGERYGVHWSNDTYGNVHLGALTHGPLNYSVRDRGMRNYTAIAAHDTAPDVVTFQVGSAQNHVDVLHPGGRTSILTSYINNGTLSGTSANTISSPHTGERVGSRSSRFTDRLADTGNSPLSLQGWCYEGGANALGAYCVDTSDSGIAGITVNRGANANWAGFYMIMSGSYWTVRTAGAAIARWYSNVLRPEIDNSMDLGTAAHRWKQVYASNAAINTSDARLKTAVDSLSDAEIAAAAQLSREIGSYRWLEAISIKGDGARLHIGLTVQRVIEVLEDHGLTAMDYGFVCYDSWDAEDATEHSTGREAGDIFSLRHDELLLFIARGQTARLDAIESKLK